MAARIGTVADSYPQTCHPQGGGATADAGEDTRRRFGLSGFRTGFSGDVLSLNQ